MAYGKEMKRLNPCGDAEILALLQIFCPGAQNILDAGCGRGDRLAALRAALPEAALWGIELEEENAKAARTACPQAEILNGDLCALPWGAESFDLVLCECTLSLTEPEAALRELRRVLRPGGMLLLGDLCAEGQAAPAQLDCGTVRRLFFRDWLETQFRRQGFLPRQYTDCREALLTMAAQMIFDGSFCCVDAGAAAALKKYRATYGLWLLKKEA